MAELNTISISAIAGLHNTGVGSSQMVYTIVAKPAYGKLRKDDGTGNYTSLGDGDTFTQEDISNKLIDYIHQGATTHGFDEWSFTVTDPDGTVLGSSTPEKNYISIRQPGTNKPYLLRNNKLTVTQAFDQVVITNNFLQASDGDSVPGSIFYYVEVLPHHGKLRNGSTPILAGDIFTQLDIDQGRITYHDLGTLNNLNDKIQLIVSDDAADLPSAPDISSFGFEIDASYELDTSLTSPNSSLFYNSSWSYSGWFKIGNLPAGNVGYIYRLECAAGGVPSASRQIYIENDAGVYNLYVKVPNSGGTEAHWKTTSSTLQLSQWQHLVVSFDNSNPSAPINIYLNGTALPLSQITGFSGTALTTRYGNRIFIYNYDESTEQSRNFVGDVDETAFFSKALSVSEVTTIYNDGNSFDFVNNSSAPSNLIAWWRFGDIRRLNGSELIYGSDSVADGEIIYDRSGKGNDLTIENSYGSVTQKPADPTDSFSYEHTAAGSKMVAAITFPTASEITGV